MTTITGVGPAGPPGTTDKTARRNASGFSVPSNPETSTAAAADGARGPAVVVDAGLVGLLVLQSEDGDDIRDRPARARGRDLLAGLAALQRAVLVGSGRAELAALTTLLADMPSAVDPRLQAALADITLRVRVELARRGLG